MKKKKRQFLSVPFVPQLSANKIIVQYLNLDIGNVTDTVNIIMQIISVFGMELSIDFRNWRTWNAVPESSEMVYLEPLIPDKVMSWASPSDHAMCNFIHRISKFSFNFFIFFRSWR